MGDGPLNRVFLGLESGGTKLCASLCDEAERSLGYLAVRRPENASAEDTLGALISLGRRLWRDSGLGDAAPAGVGWGFGGLVDREKNRPVVNYHEEGWDRIEAIERLGEALGAPVAVENDCKLAGLAEAHHGAGSTRGLMIYLTLGSGIGGSLIWNGEILAAGRYGEMEIGHIEVVPGGAPCPCGRRGCLEAYCSGWGLGERARERAADHAAESALAREILACPPQDRAKALLARWPDDPFARGVAADLIEKLSSVCAQLIPMLSPGRLVIGGGLSRAAGLVAAVGAAAGARLPERMRGQTIFGGGKLDEAAVSFGAAMYARRKAG